MFNQPTSQMQNQQPDSKPLADVSSSDYAAMANLYTQIIGALTNLRNKTFDMIDTAYEIQNILKTHPEYLDSLSPKIDDFYQVFDYAYTRYRQAVGNLNTSLPIDAQYNYFCKAVDALSIASTYDEYKMACDQLQRDGEAFTSFISFLLENFQNRLKDIEVDVEVGPHRDDLSDLYPDRFKSMMSSSENRKILAYKSSLKANQLSSTIEDVASLVTALSISKGLINTFQSKQSVFIKQIQAFSEREDKTQADKIRASLKEWIAHFMNMVASDWSKLQELWAKIDSPSSPINDVDPDTSRHLRQLFAASLPSRPDSIIAIYRNAIRWTDNLMLGLNKTKQSGGVQDKRSKWYIGNKNVAEDFAYFKSIVDKASAANAAKPMAADHGNGGISLKILSILGTVIKELTKFATDEVALDLSRGEKWVQDSLSKSKLYWSQINSFYDAYLNSKNLMLNTKAFDKAFDDYSDAYNKLQTVTAEKDRFFQIKRMVDITPGVLSAIQAITVKPNIESTDASVYSGNLALVQTGWRDLASKYSEMLKAAPNDVAMQVSHLIDNPPELKGNYVKAFAGWYGTISKLLDQILAFAIFYIRIKSLYPLTIGMRTMNDIKDADNIKYVESMGALLHEALSGKSLTSTKTALLREALSFYPDDDRVIVANKMYDLAMSGY